MGHVGLTSLSVVEGLTICTGNLSLQRSLVELEYTPKEIIFYRYYHHRQTLQQIKKKDPIQKNNKLPKLKKSIKMSNSGGKPPENSLPSLNSSHRLSIFPQKHSPCLQCTLFPSFQHKLFQHLIPNPPFLPSRPPLQRPRPRRQHARNRPQARRQDRRDSHEARHRHSRRRHETSR